jgi:hypothetical protein
MRIQYCTSLLGGLALAACAGAPHQLPAPKVQPAQLKPTSPVRPVNANEAATPASPVAADKANAGAAWQTLATGDVMRLHALGDGVYVTSGFNIGELKADGLTWRPELERGLPRGDHSYTSRPALLNLHGAFAQRALATSTRASGAPSTFGPEPTRYYWSSGSWHIGPSGAAGFANLEQYATSGMNEQAIAEFSIGQERVHLMTTYPNGTSDGLDTGLIDRNIAHCKLHPARYVGMQGALSTQARATLPAIPSGYCVADFRAYEGAGYMLVLQGERGLRIDVIDEGKTKSYRAEQPSKRVEISGYPSVSIKGFGGFSVEGTFSSHSMRAERPPGSTYPVHFEVKDGVRRDLPIAQTPIVQESDPAEKRQVLGGARAGRKEVSTRIEGRVWSNTPYRKLANYYVSNGSLYDLEWKHVEIKLDAAGMTWLTSYDGQPYSERDVSERTEQLAVQDAYELGDRVFVSLTIPVMGSYGSADGLLAAFTRAPGSSAATVKGERGAMSDRSVPKITLRITNGAHHVSGPLVCAHENAIVPIRIVSAALEAEALRELAAAEKSTEARTVEVVRGGGQSYLYQSGESGDQLSGPSGAPLKPSQTAYCLPMKGDFRHELSAGQSRLLPSVP